MAHSPDRPEALFPKLPSGRSRRRPDDVVSHQRTRLMGAMVDASARHGYSETTIRELVALAGVSYTAFYEIFDSKEACFLATFDEVVIRGFKQFDLAYRSKDDFEDRLRAGYDAYVNFVLEEGGATYLTLVDSLSLGAVGVARRQGAADAFEKVFRVSFDQMSKSGEVSDLTIRAIVGGIQRIVFSSVRTGQTDHLREDLDELLKWGLSYRGPMGLKTLQLPQRRTPPSSTLSDQEFWNEPPSSFDSRATLSQRERIIRAAAMVAANDGYGSLTIPSITGLAGVSNQTFYEHFGNKEETFNEALDVLGHEAMVRIAAAAGTEDDWATAIVAGLEELLRFSAENPKLSRLPFIEALAAGSAGLAHVDTLISRLTAMFDLDNAPIERAKVPDVVVQAVAGGIYAVLQREIEQDRARSLPELLPEIAFIALAPFSP